ncbi:hypothetical protein TI39_contig364g00002 [Zymoseptoria brevis]|uniref:Heme oxygenase-like protein n=1 Tax=Zymoseptoria brevis TaxID=1047168 RepID=A0A0F4GPG3_9PEZI|nr:hypothetical protein TI39_contig364g00002 [Zymoseptoria brevis]
MMSHTPPTPAPPPPRVMAVSASSNLSDEINRATRSQHIELNRLLINRLSLALPPHSSTPLLYGKGLVPFARIFLFFEIEWEILTRQVQQSDGYGNEHAREVQRWLANLRPAGLARTARLKDDLRDLRTLGGGGIFDTIDLGEDWMKSMRMTMRRQPHVLVAFAWVFYMATFSGGRWIRQQLANSGDEFWKQNPPLENDTKTPNLELPGFTFLSFDGTQDGEDIKADFKFRLGSAESLLTSEEKDDIILVSQQLFERCTLLVSELDQKVWRENLRSWSWPIVSWSSMAVLTLALLRYVWRFVGL